MENMQSAEKAYKEIEAIKATNKQTSDALKDAQDKLAALEKMNQESNLATENEALKRTIKQMEETIRGYQDLNQKLFLQVGKPVDEKPPMSEDERANQEILAQLEKKIEAYNASLEKGE